MRRNICGRNMKQFVYVEGGVGLKCIMQRIWKDRVGEGGGVGVGGFHLARELAQRACSFWRWSWSWLRGPKGYSAALLITILLPSHNHHTVIRKIHPRHTSAFISSIRVDTSGRPHGSGQTSLAGRASQHRSCRRRLRLDWKWNGIDLIITGAVSRIARITRVDPQRQILGARSRRPIVLDARRWIRLRSPFLCRVSHAGGGVRRSR